MWQMVNTCGKLGERNSELFVLFLADFLKLEIILKFKK